MIEEARVGRPSIQRKAVPLLHAYLDPHMQACERIPTLASAFRSSSVGRPMMTKGSGGGGALPPALGEDRRMAPLVMRAP